MAGDDVNDAPALARADLGLTVISGTDVALGAADLILIRTDLNVVPSAIKIARSTPAHHPRQPRLDISYNIAALAVSGIRFAQPADRRWCNDVILTVRRVEQGGALVPDVVIDPLRRSVTCPRCPISKCLPRRERTPEPHTLPQNLLKASISTDLRESHHLL
jgi:hypothetical protein